MWSVMSSTSFTCSREICGDFWEYYYYYSPWDGPSIRSWTSPDSSINFLDVPITVNKCLLDIACNQLISIHLNVEFIEVPVPLAPLYIPLQRPLQMGLINSLSSHPSIASDHSSSGQQHPDRRTDNRTGVESTAIQGVCLPLDMRFAIFCVVRLLWSLEGSIGECRYWHIEVVQVHC